jgi:hypothetical protein
MKLRWHQTLDAQGRQCAALIDPSPLSVSELGRDHRYDSERAGVHDKNVIAHQDVCIAAVFRSIFDDPRRKPVEMNRPRNGLANRDREVHVGERRNLFTPDGFPDLCVVLGR